MTESTAQAAANEVAGPPGMVLVPAGPFIYGQGKGRREQELEAFWIDLTPVTNRQYAAYMEKARKGAPPHWPADGLTDELADLPVVNVNYDEAEAYARFYGKRLPSPAQFEKAARGPEGRKYPWGDSVGLRCANSREAGIGDLTPVDRFPAGKSPYGCLDMNGNVLHWTDALYDRERGTRVLKGCSFRHFLGAAAWTYEEEPRLKRDYVGFRCVMPAGASE